MPWESHRASSLSSPQLRLDQSLLRVVGNSGGSALKLEGWALGDLLLQAQEFALTEARPVSAWTPG